VPCAVSGCAEVDVATDSLVGFGGSQNLTVPIPQGCYGIDNICQFKINVDSLEKVPESDEANNRAGGECAGTIF
jgi:hypothetical protein